MLWDLHRLQPAAGDRLPEILIGSVTIMVRRTKSPSNLIEILIFFTCDFQSWSFLLISKHVMFVPFNLGRSDWTLLALLSRLRALVVLCVGIHSDTTAFIRYGWSSPTFVGFRVAALKTRVQYDGFQCGVWVCWAVKTFMSLALDKNEWDRCAIPVAFDHACAFYGILHTPPEVRPSSVSHEYTPTAAVHRLYLSGRSTTVTLSVD